MKDKFLYYIIHKPYKVLSQFTDEDGNPGLNHLYKLPKDVYPVGRLDLDSEGLLILTNDKSLNHQLLSPRFNHKRTYWVEVDGQPTEDYLGRLRKGVTININGKHHLTKEAIVNVINPEVAERKPPVNYKKHPLRTWLEITITEGKNRQIRRMTAKIGHPTLRLIRVGIEQLTLGSLETGAIRQLSKRTLYSKV